MLSRFGTFFIALFAVVSAVAQTVSPDPSFGNNGYWSLSVVNQASQAGPAVTLPLANKQVIAGCHGLIHDPNGGPTRLQYNIFRLNENGTSDNSFGTNGVTSIDIGLRQFVQPEDYGRRLAIQPDGKIVGVATGYTEQFGLRQMVIFRLNSNGTIDSSFSGDGRIHIFIADSHTGSRCILVQQDGRIVVGGYYIVNNLWHFAIMRFLPNGTPDNSFGSGGLWRERLGTNHDVLRAMVQQPDGKLLVAGTSHINGSNGAVVMRLNANGSFDNSFNGNGRKTFTFNGSPNLELADMALQTDNKIVLAGSTSFSTRLLFAVARVDANGNLDNSFDQDGVNVVDFGNYSSSASSVSLQQDGRVILAGRADVVQGNNEVGLVRLNRNGKPDSTFNGTGLQVLSASPLNDATATVEVLPNGRLLLGVMRSTVPTVLRTNSVALYGTDCGPVSVQVNQQQISIAGLGEAPIATVQIFNSNWTSIFQQTYNDPADNLNVTTLPAGTYFVKLNLYTEGWTQICEKTGYHTIAGDVPVDSPDCNAITMSAVPGGIKITGLIAPIATVHIFNSNWSTVYNQTFNNSPDSVSIPLGIGTYRVKINFYNTDWSPFCEKFSNIDVGQIQCQPGVLCITNDCSAQQQTVNLNNAYSMPGLPAGAAISWHTGTPATAANKLTPLQAQNISVSGEYYAAVHIEGSDCYSGTVKVIAVINSCSTTSGKVNISTQIIEKPFTSEYKIIVAPNPFVNSVVVNIGSGKLQKANLLLLDVSGRPLISRTVQLQKGSNTVSLNGLNKYPAGNYFLNITTAEGVENFKLVRQQ